MGSIKEKEIEEIDFIEMIARGKIDLLVDMGEEYSFEDAQRLLMNSNSLEYSNPLGPAPKVAKKPEVLG